MTALGTSKLVEADKAKRMADLTECLRTYDALQLWRDAEDVLRRDVLREFVKKVYSYISLCDAMLDLNLTHLLPFRPFSLTRFTSHTPHLSPKHQSQYVKNFIIMTLHGHPMRHSRHFRHGRTPSTLRFQLHRALTRRTIPLLFYTMVYSRS